MLTKEDLEKDLESIKQSIEYYENKLDEEILSQGHEDKFDYEVLQRLYGKKEYIMCKLNESEVA